MACENGRTPDSQGVQPRTTAYAEAKHESDRTEGKGQPAFQARIESRDVIVSFRITRSLADGIDGFRVLRQQKSKTEALTNLLETGLYIHENAQRLQDPAIVKYFRENLYNIQLIDDIMNWPQDRIEAIIGALASEKERRFRIRIGKL